jgi:hypothetical protein
MAKQIINEGKTKLPRENKPAPKKDIQTHGKTKPPRPDKKK